MPGADGPRRPWDGKPTSPLKGDRLRWGGALLGVAAILWILSSGASEDAEFLIDLARLLGVIGLVFVVIGVLKD